MELLASCTLEKNKTITGKLVLPSEDTKSVDQVLINVVISKEDDVYAVFESLKGNEKCVTFKDVKVPFCPDNWKGNVFHEFSIEDISSNVLGIDGVIDLVRLPEGYSDMRTLKKYCMQFPSVRFIGGNLLQVEGVRIGRYDKGKDKGSPVYKDIYDTFVEMDLENLSGLQEIVKKARTKMGVCEKEKKERAKKVSTEKKPAKRQVSFDNMFGGSSVAF